MFETSVELCSSQDAISRAVGADILAQLGAGERAAAFPFADESEGRLVALLTDPEPVVAASALYALGHLERGTPSELAGLAKHASEDVRCALASALGGRDDVVSIAALIELCGDIDRDTRSWATFALGSLSEADSPALRDALAARLSDADDEVRGEAILGLARRADDRVLHPLERELSEHEVMRLAIEAAEAMPDRRSFPISRS